MATLGANPSASSSLDESADLIELFKLEAKYTPEYTLQISTERDPRRDARRIQIEKRWYRGDSIRHGAFGAVWVEHDHEVPDAATAVRAVKEISKGYMKSIRLDYKRELIALAQLSKVCILQVVLWGSCESNVKANILQYPDEFVQFYGWFEDTRTLYLTMEYLPYGDLSCFIEKGIPEDEVKLITIQLLEGLSIMHENLFAHRDLKPANILVKSPSPHWWVKIGDFGISKRVRENTALRTEVGTRGFLAPEIVIEGYEEYSNKTDIWSLGCVVFNSLTGVIPFPTYRALESFCSRGWFPADLLVEKQITPEGVDFIKLLLVADPADRLTAKAALDLRWLQTSTCSVRSEMVAPQAPLVGGRHTLMVTPHHQHGTIRPGKAREFRLKTSNASSNKSLSNSETLSLRLGSDTEQTDPQIAADPYIQSENIIHDEQAIQLLREHGFDINAVNFNASDALLWAASNDSEGNAVQLLLRTGADIEAKRKDDGRTALHCAACEGFERVAELLLERGADIEAKDMYGWTILVCAASYSGERVVELLLERGANIRAKDNGGKTALHYAAQRGHETAMRLLLERGANIEAKNNDGWTALRYAAWNGHERIVQLLLEWGASIEGEDKDGWSALHRAALVGSDRLVLLMLERGANIRAKDSGGWTALHFAARHGHETAVRLLLERGANVEEKNNDGWAALHYAAWNGHERTVQVLLEWGANIEGEDKGGWSALHGAALVGSDRLVVLFLENGADINAKDSNGWTALHYAARHGHEAVVRVLLERGANDRTKDAFGQTPQFLADLNKHEAVARLLLKSRPNRRTSDASGQTERRAELNPLVRLFRRSSHLW